MLGCGRLCVEATLSANLTKDDTRAAKKEQSTGGTCLVPAADDSAAAARVRWRLNLRFSGRDEPLRRFQKRTWCRSQKPLLWRRPRRGQRARRRAGAAGIGACRPTGTSAAQAGPPPSSAPSACCTAGQRESGCEHLLSEKLNSTQHKNADQMRRMMHCPAGAAGGWSAPDHRQLSVLHAGRLRFVPLWAKEDEACTRPDPGAASTGIQAVCCDAWRY